jgi:quercetin dioxygenase-like cupin family protein
MQADAPDPHATTTVFGSQSSEGYYIVRQHFAAHQTSRPHYHDKDRWVTVLSGTWYTGEGDVFKPETMVPLKPGSIMYHPANMHHYDGSMDDQEVLLQIVGYGPVSTVQTEVDDKGNPVTRPARGRGAAPAGDANPPAPSGR